MIRDIARRIWLALVGLAETCRKDASLALLVVTVVLITRHALGSAKGAALLAPIWRALAAQLTFMQYPIFQRQVIAVVLQLAVPVCMVALVHRKGLSAFGFGLGDWRFWLPITGLVFLIQIVVIAFYLSSDPTYVGRYPSLAAARSGGALFWSWESSRLFYMLSWEFLFRGYLLFALEKRMGMVACVVQMVPFVLMHMVSGKPVSEVYFTVFSGLISGVFVLESRSVWPVVFLHGVGAVMLDIFIVYG
jgi:membrane protease YdiL (CAAX protease family)